MSKRTGPTNTELKRLIEELKELSRVQNVKIWRRIAIDLEKPSRIRRSVNLYKIDKYAKEGETVVIPGKVLGVGDFTHKVDVAAFSFSKSAIEKIEKNNSSVFSIKDIIKKNPKGAKIRILG